VLTITHITPGQPPASLGSLPHAWPAEGFLWIDLEGPTDQEAAILRSPLIALDPMLIEDMLDDRHLPKVDVTGDHLMLTMHAIDLSDFPAELDTTELDIAVGRNVVITHHVEEVASIQNVHDQLERRGPDRMDRPVLLVHRLLDVMNDVFVPFLDHLEQRIDVVEEDVLSKPTAETRREIYGLQRDVIQLRRAVVPQAEVLRRVARMPTAIIDDADLPLFRDIHDHLYRMAQLSDSYRQLLESALSSYQSAVDSQLNDMLRVLTLVNTTLLPIAVIAGIYGTNFVNVPELHWRWGYFGMWGLFAVMVVGQLLLFRRAGWIGGRAEREARQRRVGLPGALEIPLLGQVLRVPVSTVRVVAGAGRSAVLLPRRILRNGRHPEPPHGASLDSMPDDVAT